MIDDRGLNDMQYAHRVVVVVVDVVVCVFAAAAAVGFPVYCVCLLVV